MRRLRIPNALCLAGLALFVFCLPLLAPSEIAWRLLGAGLVFCAGFALFAAGIVAGGDVKALSVLVLFVPSAAWLVYAQVFAVSLLAGIALVALAQRLPGAEASGWAMRRERGAMPMGLSIALSGLVLPLIG